MPTRAQFRLTLAMLVTWSASMAWVRLWAARNASVGGVREIVADSVNVAI